MTFRSSLRRLVLPCLAGAVMSSCASAPPLVDDLPNGRVQGDAAQVSVRGGRWETLPLAVAHCARFGLSAAFARIDADRSVFKCVRGG